MKSIKELKDLFDGVYDVVEKPLHYNWLKKEVIEIIKDCLTPEEYIGYLKGNIIKYSLRAGLKDYDKLEEDLGKRNKYLNWLLDELKLLKKENKHDEEKCDCPDCRYLHG